MEKSGKYAWAALAAGVATYDLLSNDSLTAAFHRGLENPRSRPWVTAGLGMTALHLMKLWPRPIDPFYMLIDHTPLGDVMEK